MNKFLSLVALCSLLLAPGCGNFLWWRKPKNINQPLPVEPKRKSGPSGWNISMDKE